MKRKIEKSTAVAVTILISIIGGLLVGGATAFLFQERDNFTPSQKLYIMGVYTGAGYLQTALDLEKQQPPMNPDSLLMRPHDRCIRSFFPSQQISLAGCLDAVGGKTNWSMPR